MHAPLRIAVLLALAILSQLSYALGQQATDTIRVTITGTVIDGVTRRPLSGVEVSLSEAEIVVQSDEAGQFVLSNLLRGTYQMAVAQEGYVTASGPIRIETPGAFTVVLVPEGAGEPVGTRGSGRVAGLVLDQESGDPLEDVEVRVDGTDLIRLTDSRGRFAFPVVRVGQQVLTFGRLGYGERTESITVEPNRILTLQVWMGIEAIELNPISVEVEAKSLPLEMAGFYDRRDATAGFFITQEQIEARMPLYTTDLFDTAPGVTVRRGGIDRVVLLTGSRAISIVQHVGGCYPSVWIDGQSVHQSSGEPAHIDRLINPDQIAGIEIYHRASRIPPQYNIGAACGVIVIWSR